MCACPLFVATWYSTDILKLSKCVWPHASYSDVECLLIVVFISQHLRVVLGGLNIRPSSFRRFLNLSIAEQKQQKMRVRVFRCWRIRFL